MGLHIKDFSDVEIISAHYGVTLPEAKILIEAYGTRQLLGNPKLLSGSVGQEADTEIIGTTIDELGTALNAMEESLASGQQAKLELCTEQLPTDADLASFYLGLVNGGFHVSYPQASIIHGVPTTTIVLRKGSPQWVELIGVLPTIFVVGLIAFGITQIGAIGSALLPIIVTVVLGIVGLAIIASKRGPPKRLPQTMFLNAPLPEPLQRSVRAALRGLPTRKLQEAYEALKENRPTGIEVVEKNREQAINIVEDVLFERGKFLPRTLGRRDLFMKKCLQTGSMKECSDEYNRTYGLPEHPLELMASTVPNKPLSMVDVKIKAYEFGATDIAGDRPAFAYFNDETKASEFDDWLVDQGWATSLGFEMSKLGKSFIVGFAEQSDKELLGPALDYLPQALQKRVLAPDKGRDPYSGSEYKKGDQVVFSRQQDFEKELPPFLKDAYVLPWAYDEMKEKYGQETVCAHAQWA